MNPTEQFDKAFESAFKDRDNFITYVNTFSKEQAIWEPPDNEWSIIEGIEHTLLVDVFFRKSALEVLNEAEKTGNWITKLENKEKMSLEALRKREQGFVPSPESLLPRGRSDLQQMIRELYPSKMAIHECLISFREIDLSSLVPNPRPKYGALNIYERIYYSGIHDYLHQEQMNRVTQHKTFPNSYP
tara:strand:+ start:6948 stop:7508 length:561 start_codon:yes stop_codon:yes gene_type:complete